MDDKVDAPIACSLEAGAYRERLAWIAALTKDGLVGVSRDDLRLELTYRSEVAGRVREMVDQERQCCAFLDFALAETAAGIRLTITAPERAREVADDLFQPFVILTPSTPQPPRPWPTEASWTTRRSSGSSSSQGEE